jgi:hypothetical protein
MCWLTLETTQTKTMAYETGNTEVGARAKAKLWKFQVLDQSCA